MKKLRRWLPGEGKLAQPSADRHSKLHTPQVACRTEFCGADQYGGWTLCPDGLSAQSVMYSFGVGEDASFDLAAIRKYGLQVYAFDPTPRSIEWVKRRDWPPEFHFYPFGIAAKDGTEVFYPPENPEHVSHTILDRPTTADRAIEVEMKRLCTIADMLDHRHIDVLKLDIEGAEYAVIEDIARTSEVEIDQILIEFHHFFPNVTIDQTLNTVERLNELGYQIFHVSPGGKEYSFINQ
jgi:FkbM family methyltransferase